MNTDSVFDLRQESQRKPAHLEAGEVLQLTLTRLGFHSSNLLLLPFPWQG